jgi:hypothetical protein
MVASVGRGDDYDFNWSLHKISTNWPPPNMADILLSSSVATQMETCESEKNGSWCTRVTWREYLKTKESVAGNLGTTTGHAILGEHMWASDKALGAEGTRRG